MYKVIHEFLDLQDNSHYYAVGKTFPRRGVKVSKERIEELSTSANKIGVPLIEAPEAKIQPVKGENKAAEETTNKVKKAPRKAKKEK